MAELSLTEHGPGDYRVAGDLTFAAMNKQTLSRLKLLHGGQGISVDLQAVQSADSAGLALMIEWLKLGKISNIRVSFKNIPEQLHSLAKLVGLDESQYFTGDM